MITRLSPRKLTYLLPVHYNTVSTADWGDEDAVSTAGWSSILHHGPISGDYAAFAAEMRHEVHELLASLFCWCDGRGVVTLTIHLSFLGICQHGR